MEVGCGGVIAPDMDRLRQLADAYGVDGSTLTAVGDAIISRTPISSGSIERESVSEVVGFIVQDEGTLESLRADGGIPTELHSKMVTAVEQHGPAMPAATLVMIVIADVCAVLGGRADA